MAYHTDHSLHRILKTGGRFFLNGGSKLLDIIHQQTTVIAKKTSDLTNTLKYPWQLQYTRALRYTSLKWKALATIRL
jgi:hypothetical protein